MNVQDITVDLSKKNIKPESIVLRQGDKSGTTLRVKVLDNGVNVSSLSGYTAKFIMKLPYNRFYYEVEGTINGSMLTFVIDESYAAVQSGVTNIAYVALVNGETTKMSANNIRVEILPSALDGFTPPPEWTDPVDQFMAEQTARVDTIVASAESATTSANTAATNANDKASLANTAATNANEKATLANDAATNANAKADIANAAAQAADAAREAIQDDLAAKADVDAHVPLLTVGAADSLLSTDEQTDTFTQRVSDHDGSVGVRAILGNTVVWNQLADISSFIGNNATLEKNEPTCEATCSSSATSYFGIRLVDSTSGLIKSGRKYLVLSDVDMSGLSSSVLRVMLTCGNIAITTLNGNTQVTQSGKIACIITVADTASLYLNATYSSDTTGVDGDYFSAKTNIFDLTKAFGAGNELSTVAEFEALYPENYYPYDAGELLPVNMEGVETVGFNQWDEVWENGDINTTTGQNVPNSAIIRSKNYIPVLPSTTYYFRIDTVAHPSAVAYILYYDADKNLISDSSLSHTTFDYKANAVITSPSNARYMRFKLNGNYMGTYANDICINLSWSGYRNGEYEPYWEFERAIDVETYFPNGMRSAGTAFDELRSDKAITRIGSVDLGTLNWIYDASNNYFATTDITSRKPGFNALKCVKYETASSPATTTLPNNQIVGGTGSVTVYIRDSNYTNAATFKAAMSGVMLYYELATPTETAIDPPLNLAYPTEQGGTESIIIPTGEMSAAPTMAIVYAYDADGVRDLSQAIIATIEGNTASTNYAIGGYFVHAGMLYKATSAIATGETINPGTNCVQTTVMAELVALTT